MATAKKVEEGVNFFESLTAFQPEAFKECYEKLTDNVASVVEFNKASTEAVFASFGAFTKGVESIAAEQSKFVSASFEKGLETAKNVSTAKSVQDTVDISAKYVREALEANLSQTNKVANLLVETAKDTATPITDRYSEVVEKVQSFRP